MKQRYIEEVEERYVKPPFPVQIVWGRNDAWIALSQGQKLANRIAGGTLIAVPDAGHLVQEDTPEAIVAAVLARSS
jgi:pimeloyl-ACP methyl ester carboxylesterase